MISIEVIIRRNKEEHWDSDVYGPVKGACEEDPPLQPSRDKYEVRDTIYEKNGGRNIFEISMMANLARIYRYTQLYTSEKDR